MWREAQVGRRPGVYAAGVRADPLRAGLGRPLGRGVRPRRRARGINNGLGLGVKRLAECQEGRLHDRDPGGKRRNGGVAGDDYS
eukprot:7987848-Heterocapsa_arctica.AAC.1